MLQSRLAIMPDSFKSQERLPAWRELRVVACVASLILTALTQPAAGQEEAYPRLSVGGLAFGDLYHALSNHLDDVQGATGVVLRRAYLTANVTVDPQWFGRLRFEVNQSGQFETYTYKIQFKDLYAGLKLGGHTILAGLVPTPTFDLIESLWGFRYLARTPLDMQGVASRDNGVSSRGPITSNEKLSYRSMIGSGLAFGAETGDGLKWMGAVTWAPSSAWTVDLYADYERLAGSHDRRTLQAFVSYWTAAFRAGVQYSNQDRQDDPPLELASVYAVARLDETVSIVGRIDRLFKPSPGGNGIAYLPFDPSAPATLIISGVEFRIMDFLFITPNTVFTVYGKNDEGSQPRNDLLARMTLFLNLE